MRKLVQTVGITIVLLALCSPLYAQIGFGNAVATGEGEVLIGEPGNQATPGFVYVYRPGSGGWTEAIRLTGSRGEDADGFGASLSLDGDRLLVGASGAGSGVAYVFERDGEAWRETAVLTPADGAAGDLFGSAVAISGEVAVVGAPGAAGKQGAAYVFVRQGSGWGQAARLTGEGGDVPEHFGAAVVTDGDWAIVGAPAGKLDFFLAGYSSSPATGAAYVFQRGAAGWDKAARLTDSAAGSGAAFGHAMSLADGQAMIGAPGAHGFVGEVYLYLYSQQAESWMQLPGLAPYDRMPSTFFGASIQFDADEAFIGAPGSLGLQGRVYHFRREGVIDWTAASKLGAAGLGQFAVLGASVAAAGDLVVAGVPGNDYGAGTAVIMERGYGGWDRTAVMSDLSGLDPVLDGTIECVDGKAGPFLCDNVDLVAFLPVHEIGGGRGVGVNDIWGWTDPETGRDYAVIGMRDGTSFVDVTDPGRPVWVGKLAKSDAANASLWRDVKVHNNHAFIVSDNSGRHGVQIFDLTRLREFDGTALTFSEDARYDGVNSAHNFVINEGSEFAYVVGASGGGETCGGGLHMINIEDPRNPVFAGCFSHAATGRSGTGYSHDANCVIYQGPDERYRGHEICFGSNETALSIADVTDKRNPVAIATGTYPNVAYSHQGWITPDHRYFYMNDELDEFAGLVPGTRTLIFDIQELDDPILVGEYQTDNTATDHNLYIVGDVMYQSNYRSGLRVVDISDPENPQPLGYFDTVPWGPDDGMGDIISGSIGSWSNYPFFESGVVLVNSGREGLFVVRLRRD